MTTPAILPAISVIMPSYNRAHDLPKVLAAWEQQIGEFAFELIAVDDCSTDSTFDLLRNYRARRFTLITRQQARNQGPAAARNLGINLAQAPLLCIVGDDIAPAPNFLQQHLALHHANPEIGVSVLGLTVWPADLPVNTLMQHIDGIGAQQFSYYYLKSGQYYDYRHFYTSNISLKAALLEKVDRLFDTDFEFAAYEDAELAYRLVPHGLKILYSNLAIASHFHYHTVWTFADRQYKVGRMHALFNRKHPQMVTLSHRLLRGWLRLALGLKIWAAVRGLSPNWLAQTEAAALLHASHHEWLPNPELDRFYLAVLMYFYRKGFIDGMVSGQAAWQIHAWHAARTIVPATQRLMQVSL